jgi:putative redox protein
MANQALVTWKEGMHFEGLSNQQTVQMDVQPPNGQGLGVSPMNLVLVALGGCTAMDIVSILQKERQDLTGLSIAITGERAADYPMVYTQIRMIYTVRGRSLKPAAVERAVRLSEEKYCSVGAMLAKSAQIETQIVIEEEV